VYAPANEALAQAIALKRQGHVARVVAGPVNAFVPSECGGILLSPEIDIVIVASAWVRDFYRTEAPILDAKVRVCPAGVDVRYWAPGSRPAGSATGRRAVVYEKGVSDALCRASNDLIEQLGIEVTRVKYGAYDPADFKAALSDATVAVFLSPFETQGLAMAEAWAMNVPTLAWDPQGATEWKGHSFVAGSSCPYLTPATGRAWRTLPELDAALRATLASPAYTPRDWVLAHMTDAICSEALYRIVRDAAPPS
jgi:hypothetical protein